MLDAESEKAPGGGTRPTSAARVWSAALLRLGTAAVR